MTKESKEIIKEAEEELSDIYKEVNDIEFYNSNKVLKAFHECNVTEDCLSSPWKEKEKCIFTETMRYFGILENDYQDKGQITSENPGLVLSGHG